VQTVDGVRNTELGGEDSFNIRLVAQIDLKNDGLGAIWNLGLNNIRKDEVDIGSERIVVDCGGKLQRR